MSSRQQPRPSMRALDASLAQNVVPNTVLLLDSLDKKMDRLVWLNEGPDDYQTIDDTISPTQEMTYSFDPMVLWSVNFVNNAASGGPNLFVRFTSEHGRVKQAKIPAGATLKIAEIRGQLGMQFRVITDTATAEFIATVMLKFPLPTPYGSGT